MRRQSLQIVVQRFCDLFVLVLGWAGDQRRILDDAAGSVVLFSKAG